MKILIDTNVILDVILNREPFAEDSSLVLKLCETKKHIGFLSASTITDIYYILNKQISDKSKIYIILEKLLTIIEICDVTKNNVLSAIKIRHSDFEDAIQSECANSISANFIITRNIKDFTNSVVKAITPSEFLKSI